MFIVTWLFDKLGYMPKMDVQVGVVNSWPFPAEVEVKSLAEKPVPIKKQVKKPTIVKKRIALKKATTRKAK